MSNSHAVGISGVPQPAETKNANDGALYTRAQFESHYGKWADWYWERAATPTDVYTKSQPNEVATDAKKEVVN